MANLLEQLPQGARVAVIRLRSLGDCVLTTPALRLLKQHRPDLRVGIVVEDRFAAVFTGNPDVDEILRPSFGRVARFRPRLAINLHGGSRSLLLSAASGATYRAGFAHFRGAAFYGIRIPTAQEILGVQRTVHTAEHLASAMFYLGVPATEIPRTRLYCERHRANRPYAVLHPMASAPDKTWPAAQFLEVAETLRRDFSLDPVFIAGPGESLSPFRAFHTLPAPPLEETKSLLAGASLFIGNDSGPAHMAAAFDAPVVVLFFASDPAIWAPWKARSEVIVRPADPTHVLNAVERLLVRA
jgi:heptosyltransferase III